MSAPHPDAEDTGSGGVVHFVDRPELLQRVEGHLTALTLPETVTWSPDSRAAQGFGDVFRIPVPWPAEAGTLELRVGGVPQPQREKRLEVAAEGGYLLTPAVQRTFAADCNLVEGRSVHEAGPPGAAAIHVRLGDGQSVGVRTRFDFSDITLSVRARALRGPCRLDVEVRGVAVGTIPLTSGDWEELALRFETRPQAGMVKLTARGEEDASDPPVRDSDSASGEEPGGPELVAVQWLETRTPRDSVLVKVQEPDQVELHYTPRLPRAEEPLGNVGPEPRTLWFLSLGGECSLATAQGELSTLQLDGAAVECPAGADSIALGRLPAGLHTLEVAGRDAELSLLQDVAHSLPLLSDRSHRLSSDQPDRSASSSVARPLVDALRTRLECRGDRRASFWLPTPSAVEVEATLAAGDRLRWSAGAHDRLSGPNHKPMRGSPARIRLPEQVEFSVTWTPFATDTSTTLDRTVWNGRLSGWEDREVVVPEELAGQGILRFATTAPGEGCWGAAVADPRLVPATADSRAPRFHLLLYLVDTLRADHLSVYGYPKPTSPRLEEIARDGYTFERCYAAASWTRPSAGAVFTGLYPRYHGATGYDRALTAAAATLAEVLSEAGYSTLGAAANFQVAAQGLRFEQGFHRFLSPQALRSAPGTSSAALNDAVLPWLAECGDEPWFLSMHSLDPHGPYAPPREFREPFVDPDYDGPLLRRVLDPRHYLRDVSDQLEPRDVDYVRAMYDGAIRHQDEQIGRLVRALEEEGLRERTLLVFYSDHGEEFLEHGSWDHGGRMWEELLRVPLIVWVPPGLRSGLAPPGTRIDAPVSHVDVLPTLLELLGIDDLHPRQGQSFLPLLRTAPTEPRTILAQEGKSLHSIVEWPYKMIFREVLREGWRDHPREERFVWSWQIYDLESDPGEQLDLFPSRPDLHRDLLLALEQKTRTLDAVGERFRSTDGSVDLSAEALSQLQELGYLEQEQRKQDEETEREPPSSPPR